MTCPNCSALVADDQQFCSKCGHRVQENLGSLSERLAKIESQLLAGGKEQKYLEHEAVENVMNRVRSWTTLFLYFAGIPVAIAALALAITFGKGSYDLHGLAANTKKSVEGVVNEARTTAANAVTEANKARDTSQQVSSEVKNAQQRVAELQTQIETRLTETRKLETRINEAQGQVTALSNRVSSESQKVTNLSQQLQHAETQKNLIQVRNQYVDLYGELVAQSYEGVIAPKGKKPNEIWIDVQLADYGVAHPNPVKDTDLAELMQSLDQNGYRVFSGIIQLSKSSGSTSTWGGAEFDRDGCQRFGNTEIPCILYFHENLKSRAMQIRTLVNHAQTVPESNIRFATQLSDAEKILLERSAMDMVVILGAKKPQ